MLRGTVLVVFDYNYDDSTSVERVAIGGAVVLPELSDRVTYDRNDWFATEGFRFMGWTYTRNGNDFVDEPFIAERNVILYASWAAGWAVIFVDGNRNQLTEVDPFVVSLEEGESFGLIRDLLREELDREGAIFDRWRMWGTVDVDPASDTNVNIENNYTYVLDRDGEIRVPWHIRLEGIWVGVADTSILRFSEIRDENDYVVSYGVSLNDTLSLRDRRAITTLYIPTERNGKPITRIDYAAFFDIGNLQTLLPNLMRISLPDTVTVIGALAFSDIHEDRTLGRTGLRFINIPTGLLRIEDRAFRRTALADVVVPRSVTAIGDEAFQGSEGLQRIWIPNSVTGIGSGAFGDCRNLTIYTEWPSRPDGWSTAWNPNVRPVMWGQ
jgi:hypothetical protein